MNKENFKGSFSKDSVIHLKQQIIHYRSEISRLENELKDYEQKLNVCREKFNEQKKGSNLKENKKQGPFIESKICSQAHFSYTTILPESKENEIMIIGNFILKNIGNTTLNTPIICIRISPAECGKLSGKIKYSQPLKENEEIELYDELASEQWIYIHENWKELTIKSGEHWLKPIHKTTLQPEEQMNFSNFTLLLSPLEDGGPIIVSGYVYFEELQQGVTSLNQIIVNV